MKFKLLSFLSIIVLYAVLFLILSNQPSAFIHQKFLALQIGYCMFVICVGFLILFIQFKKEQFVGRFMMITVFQMLAILTFVSALVYIKVEPLRHISLQFILIYMVGFLLQTLILLRFSKKTS